VVDGDVVSEIDRMLRQLPLQTALELPPGYRAHVDRLLRLEECGYRVLAYRDGMFIAEQTAV
jgi:hypothetical protein